jgi:hypothetical protein
LNLGGGGLTARRRRFRGAHVPVGALVLGLGDAHQPPASTEDGIAVSMGRGLWTISRGA